MKLIITNSNLFQIPFTQLYNLLISTKDAGSGSCISNDVVDVSVDSDGISPPNLAPQRQLSASSVGGIDGSALIVGGINGSCGNTSPHNLVPKFKNDLTDSSGNYLAFVWTNQPGTTNSVNKKVLTDKFELNVSQIQVDGPKQEIFESQSNPSECILKGVGVIFKYLS